MTALSDRGWWTRLAVGLSLALNVFFVAFLLVQAARPHFQPAPEATMSPREILRQLAENLPPGDAQRLRQAFVRRLPDLAAAQRQARSAGEQLRSDIAARPLDLDKVRTDLEALRAARERMRPLVEQALLEALSQMSDDGRMMLGRYRLRPSGRRLEP